MGDGGPKDGRRDGGGVERKLRHWERGAREVDRKEAQIEAF